MRAVTQASFGGPEELKIDLIDKPIPGAGQVLVKVIATSVNRPDVIQRQGNYPPPPGDSEVLGLEMGGHPSNSTLSAVQGRQDQVVHSR